MNNSLFEPTNSCDRSGRGKLRYAMVLDRTSLKRCVTINFKKPGCKTRGGLDTAVIDEFFAIGKSQAIDINDEPFRTLTERIEKESMFL